MFFIRQLMHFSSGILLYKNLPIYSMVNRISFCSRNLIFFLCSCLINLKNFPLFIVCGNKFYFGHVFIRQLMHFPSGILLYKNLPIHSIFPVTDDATAASGFGFFRRQKSCTQKSFPKEGIYLPALSIAWEINSSLLKSAPCFSCSFSMSLFRLFVRLITWA